MNKKTKRKYNRKQKRDYVKKTIYENEDIIVSYAKPGFQGFGQEIIVESKKFESNENGDRPGVIITFVDNGVHINGLLRYLSIWGRNSAYIRFEEK